MVFLCGSALTGCQMGQRIKDFKPNWPAACANLQKLDRAVARFQKNYDPGSDLYKAFEEIRTKAAGTITAVCLIAVNPDAPDPAPLAWSTVNLARDLITEHVDDQDDKEMYLLAIAGVEGGLIFANIPEPPDPGGEP